MSGRKALRKRRPSREQPPPGLQTRIAMALGAEMARAQEDLERPNVGEEAATRAGRAARAAALAFVDDGHPETTGMPATIVIPIAQQAYATEWSRLAQTPRERWHE